MDSNILTKEVFDYIMANVLIHLNILVVPSNAPTDTINLLTLYINKICSEITILTNRSKFPNDLKYIVIDMVCDLYSSSIKELKANSKEVQSMSEAGRSVSLGLPDVLKNKYDTFIQQELTNRKTQINRYKLLYKVGCNHGQN